MKIPYFKMEKSYHRVDNGIKDKHLSYYTWWYKPHNKVIYGQTKMLNIDDYIDRYCCDQMKKLIREENEGLSMTIQIDGRNSHYPNLPTIDLHADDSEYAIGDLKFCMYCGEKLEVKEIEQPRLEVH